MTATGVQVRDAAVAYRSRDEALEVIDRTFRLVDEDEKAGPILRAAGLRERLELSDLDIAVGLEAAASGDDCLEWTFEARPGWDPKISLTMDSPVANSILQGAESIGVAIARRRIRVEGDAGAALIHLPATRLICKHYRDLIEREYPHLVVAL
jgi:hypothetical protein